MSKSKIFHKLRTWFLAGLIVVLPVVITIYVISLVVGFFDSVIFRWLFPNANVPIPGFGVVVGVLLVVFVGMITTNLLGKYIMNLGESIVDRIPLVKTIYSSSKQIFFTLFSDQSRSFREVVLFEYPRKGIWVMGFLTSENHGEVNEYAGGKDDVLNIFLPTTPNPTSGFLLFVPRKDVVFLKMNIDIAMKMVISAGVLDQNNGKEKNKS